MKNRMAPRPRTLTIPPLSADIKLQAVNKLRLTHKLLQLNSVAPPQITLTPAAPSMGTLNYLEVTGLYITQPGSMRIILWDATESVRMTFQTSTGKTYLLDVAIDPSDPWIYSLRMDGVMWTSPENITPQQGHLLLPFIAVSSSFSAEIRPGASGSFLSAQLTVMG